ncbi:hypothetical protein [Micromonospora rhizosphaerae]|uniref:hypothetical protein n=1 Tax=Micromonospora rhizosphaerae TaxID=568872 RepID=UPI001FE0A61C|nr:hypothetical protein [Micromonospora rhizosphaerae]
MLFDLLADAGGRVILDLPPAQRRARLEQLLGDAPAQLTLTPQTADMRQMGTGWCTGPSRRASRAWSQNLTGRTSQAGAAGQIGIAIG